MIKINGLKEPPKWYRYVEPGEEPDPRALVLEQKTWLPRGNFAGSAYGPDHIYAVPIYGPIPDGYELVEDGEWVPGMQYWYDDEWIQSTASSRCGMFDDLPYIHPIKPTSAERPLLTAADFMKGGPWWVKVSAQAGCSMVTTVNQKRILTKGEWNTYEVLRKEGYQRSNDGEHWEDC